MSTTDIAPAETIWEPEPDEPLFVDPDWEMYRKVGCDPAFYSFTSVLWEKLEHWWLADMASLPTADLESELEYVIGRLVALQLTPDVAEGLINGVQYRPILEQRASWLAWEIKRRNSLPDPPRVGFKIPSETVHRIKDACNLPEFLVGEIGFKHLRRQGRDYIALCPFHAEKTPSFIVHADRFHCFGCGQSGDVFDILLVTSYCRTWREAVEYVARYVGIQIPQPSLQPKPAQPVQRVVPEPIWSKYRA